MEEKLSWFISQSALKTCVLFVNDCSTDRSKERIFDVCDRQKHFFHLSFTKNSGLSAAIKAGIEAICSTFVGYIDADLQTTPEDFNLLIPYLKDFEMVMGIRVDRDDSFVKKASSKIANGFRRFMTHDGVSDTGCPLKIIRTDYAKRIPFFTGMHRFLPALIQLQNGRVKQEEYYRGDIFGKNNNYPTSTGEIDIFMTNAYSYLSFDNMDNFYFPTKGTNMYAEFSMLADFQNSSKISPVLLYKMRNVIPVTPKTSLLLDLYGRALFNSDFPQAKMTLVGGELYSQYFNYHLPFVGLSAVNIADRFAYIGLIGLRVQISESQYISVLLNGMRQGDEVKPWEKASMIYGGGIKYSLKTILGPLDMTLGYSGSTDKPSFSANFGYWF